MIAMTRLDPVSTVRKAAIKPPKRSAMRSPARGKSPQAAPMRAGSREPAASPWLVCSSDPVATVRDSVQAEPRLGPWAFVTGAVIAPATTLGAFMDWWTHLVGSPAKQLEVAGAGAAQWRRAWEVAVTGETVQPLPQDRRFADPAWQLPPYRGLMQAFLLWKRNGGSERPLGFAESRLITNKW